MIDSRQRSGFIRRGAAAAICLALLSTVPAGAQRLQLPEPVRLGPGILFYTLESPNLVSPPEPMSIRLLRVDPRQADLRAALANDEIMGTEVVSSIAERHSAIAAINAGYFQANGDPSGVLTLGGRLVSDTRRPRGAVGIARDSNGIKLTYGRLRATASLTLGEGRSKTTVPVDGIDTTRLRGKLMLYTPSYNEDTDTTATGLEWVVGKSKSSPTDPYRIVSGPHKTGKTKIPPDGFVLSYGGATPPPALAKAKRGTRVALVVSYDPLEGDAADWSSSQDIVGGAGLLIRDGKDLQDWSAEAFTAEFAEGRHPRTLIGSDSDGTIWLVTVDGRQPQSSVGMTLRELRDFSHRLGLVNALNLDGGGSTTMWVRGQIVNKPSDLAGPRPVSDVIIVRNRDGGSAREQGAPAR